ncbi:MAG: MerR family transcriptional regulator [Acidobacteria bacterium]|nr:MerR family transcriptional regulator [Acidobacteriota bacterium]
MTTLTMGFSGPAVCRITGVTYRQLDYWARTGLVTPSVSPAQGSGSKRVYSYSDVVEIKVVKSLLDAGVSLPRARQAVNCLREQLGVDVKSVSLVLSGSRSVLAYSDGDIIDLLKGGHGVFNVISLESVTADIDRSLASDNTENVSKRVALA